MCFTGVVLGLVRQYLPEHNIIASEYLVSSQTWTFLDENTTWQFIATEEIPVLSFCSLAESALLHCQKSRSEQVKSCKTYA